jgi:RimJ/RimL family protein N-acetyltransferase
MTPHPLLAILHAAADGHFPPVDGGIEVLPPDEAGTWAIVEFTGHAFVLGEVELARVEAAGADGFGGAGHPDVLRLLAGDGGWIGCHDAVLVGRTGLPPTEPPLAVRTDLEDHPRVARAREHRRDVTVYGDDSGLVVIGRGLAGRTEVAVELADPAAGGHGGGRQLIRRALAARHGQGWVFAQVSPGNAASLRAFLAAGFTPIGSEVLVHPERRHLGR